MGCRSTMVFRLSCPTGRDYDLGFLRVRQAQFVRSFGRSSSGQPVSIGEGCGVPYYVVNARNGRGAVTSRATHIMSSESPTTPGIVSAVAAGYGKQDSLRPVGWASRECVPSVRGVLQGVPETVAARDGQRGIVDTRAAATAEAKAESTKVAAGCLLTFVVIVVIIIVVVFHIGSGPNGPSLLRS